MRAKLIMMLVVIVGSIVVASTAGGSSNHNGASSHHFTFHHVGSGQGIRHKPVPIGPFADCNAFVGYLNDLKKQMKLDPEHAQGLAGFDGFLGVSNDPLGKVKTERNPDPANEVFGIWTSRWTTTLNVNKRLSVIFGPEFTIEHVTPNEVKSIDTALANLDAHEDGHLAIFRAIVEDFNDQVAKTPAEAFTGRGEGMSPARGQRDAFEGGQASLSGVYTDVSPPAPMTQKTTDDWAAYAKAAVREYEDYYDARTEHGDTQSKAEGETFELPPLTKNTVYAKHHRSSGTSVKTGRHKYPAGKDVEVRCDSAHTGRVSPQPARLAVHPTDLARFTTVDGRALGQDEGHTANTAVHVHAGDPVAIGVQVNDSSAPASIEWYDEIRERDVAANRPLPMGASVQNFVFPRSGEYSAILSVGDQIAESLLFHVGSATSDSSPTATGHGTRGYASALFLDPLVACRTKRCPRLPGHLHLRPVPQARHLLHSIKLRRARYIRRHRHA